MILMRLRRTYKMEMCSRILSKKVDYKGNSKFMVYL